jgi:6-phosphogluconolactonase
VADAPKLVVDDDPITRGGALLKLALESVLARRDRVRLAIPGGSALGSVRIARERLGPEWGRVALTWVDERCVPLASPDSNRAAATRLGLLDDDPRPESVWPLFLDGEAPEEASRRVDRALRESLGGALDVLLLGMGSDGHVASLFPGPGLEPAGNTLAAHVECSPKPPRDRITLTASALQSAQHVILVAMGEAKRSALTRLMAGDPRLPAHGLTGLVVVTDLAMKGLLDDELPL